MNKIILDSNNFLDNTDSHISCSFLSNALFDVNTLNIDVLSDTDLEIDYNFDNQYKLEVVINVKSGVKFNFFTIASGDSLKVRTKFYLEESSIVNVYKFNDIKSINDYVIIYLNGRYSSINYNLKTIAKEKEKYDVLIYHNASNTSSIINNHGVNKDGNIYINVSSFVPNGNKDCNVNQNNRIINLTNNECIIKPNLYIDEYDVSANHSALIGNFSDAELFYLMSRGISKNDSINLLIKGFLTNNFNVLEEQMNRITDILLKYWR